MGARELSTATFATKCKRARFGNRKPCLAASGKTVVIRNLPLPLITQTVNLVREFH